jgi:hypothetical protein
VWLCAGVAAVLRRGQSHRRGNEGPAVNSSSNMQQHQQPQERRQQAAAAALLQGH